MLILLICISALLLIYMAMILLRKSLWDTVHRNLLDLEDNFNGKVIRNGFAARPVFKGQIHDSDITINFSSAKTPSGRKTYIDFTLTTASRLSVTIAEKNWLTEQNHENSSDKEEINLKNNTSYLVMSSDSTKIKHIITKNDFKQALEQIENMAYFFVGKTGTICEFWSEQVDRDTEITKMKTRLENVYRLLAFIQ